MIAEILSTGDEVLLGDIVDTNAAWLCRKLKEMGIPASRITTVGDDEAKICEAIKAIAQRSDICLVTGGLGPTQDDLTAQACAGAAGKPLEKHPVAFESMAAFFRERGWALTPENEKQSVLPQGAGVLENHWGTAPGFFITITKCCFFFMPGVPSEMKGMFQDQVRPELARRCGSNGPIAVARLMVFGLPESQVGARLSDFHNRFPGLSLGFRARFPLIEVKLVQPPEAKTQTAASDLAAAKAWAISCLAPRVVSENGLTLEEEVGQMLSTAGQTLSIAESCTGGLISNLITDVPGASAYFLFSAVTYANTAKTGVLGVTEETLVAHGAVHEKTAEEMAKGARVTGGSDWAVSTTGIAGPSGGTADKPVGTVCIGVAGPSGVTARRFVLDTGDRQKNKQLFAAAALEMLRRKLSESA